MEQQKLKLIALTFLILIAAIGFGQNIKKRPAPPIPDKKSIEFIVSNLSNELSLSRKQTKQVSELYFHYFAKLKMLSNSKDCTSDCIKTTRKLLKFEFEADIKKLLNKKQVPKFEAYLNNMKIHKAKNKKPNQHKIKK